MRWSASKTQLVWPHVNINSTDLKELKDLIRIVLWQEIKRWSGGEGFRRERRRRVSLRGELELPRKAWRGHS